MVFAQQQCSPFVIYLHLQNRLINKIHCSTYYNQLLYVCGGEKYCEWLVNLADFLFSTCNFATTGTFIAGIRERSDQIQRNI